MALNVLKKAIHNHDESTVRDIARETLSGKLQNAKSLCLQQLDNYMQDDLALALMPEDIPNELLPIKTTGNGNCLYNAMSLQIEGLYMYKYV